MKKLLLVYPPSKSVYGLPHYPPLGLTYLATVIKQKGFSVTVIDMRLPENNFDYLKKILRQFKPDMVGIGSTSFDFPGAEEVFHLVKQTDSSIITALGGPHASICPERAITNPNLDYLIVGEGEFSLLKFMQTYGRKQNLTKIPGLIYKDKRGIIKKGLPAKLIENLDQIPFPDWSIYNLERYRVRGKLTLPVVSSRGCPFNCIYCVSWRTHGKRFRSRLPKNVVDEIENDLVKYNAQKISFLDDNLTLDKDRISGICLEIIRRRLKFDWTCDQGIRADSLNPKMLKLMYKSGCQLVAIGVESADETV